MYDAPNKEPVDIAIVGGGIIGLALALGLLKRDINVKIYEQSRTFREIGAGVAFTANAIRCMHIVNPDIVDALRAVATSNGDAENPNDWLQWVDGYNQQSLDPHDEQILFKLYAGYRGFEGCHRAHFLDELVKRIPEGVVEFRKRLDTIDESASREQLQLRFYDGSSAKADAVVGCDGIKSRVREILFGRGNPISYPHYTHKVAYRGLIPMDKAIEVVGSRNARNQHMHIGPGRHLLHFPVADQTLVNVAAFDSDLDDWKDDEKMTAPATRQEVEKAFADWGPTVRGITSLLPDKLDRWAIFDCFDYPAPTYTRGRICIAGDAAHASAPHHGAGAGIGVEDVLCISTLMDNVTSSIASRVTTKTQALEKAFQTFNDVRHERSQWLVNSSHNICDVYEWADPKIGKDFAKCFEEIKWRSHKIWYFDIEEMLVNTNEGYHQRLSNDYLEKEDMKAQSSNIVDGVPRQADAISPNFDGRQADLEVLPVTLSERSPEVAMASG